jgi:hypothetical protein
VKTPHPLDRGGRNGRDRPCPATRVTTGEVGTCVRLGSIRNGAGFVRRVAPGGGESAQEGKSSRRSNRAAIPTCSSMMAPRKSGPPRRN